MVCFAVFALAACGEQKAPSPAPKVAPSVDVAKVVYERITEWDEFTGRLQAPEEVALIPRVSGYLKSVNFKEGSLVQKGQVLFTIDSSEFVTEVERLKAELEISKSAYGLSKSDFQRASKLYSQSVVSEELIDTRRSSMAQSAAAVASVSAALKRAELNVEYTQVTSPISGRVSFARETAGNYVTAGKSYLTSLVSISKMYAYFDVDERTYLKYAALSAAKKRDNPRSGSNVVYMSLANDSDFGRQGQIDFVDNSVDRETGTIRVRAVFSNKENHLLPGLFARIRVAGSGAYDGVLVDDKAIFTDLNKKYVLLLGANNVLQYRNVRLGEKLHGLRIISSGLSEGDVIVVNSLQKVRPNVTIAPNLTNMAGRAQLEEIHRAQRLLDGNSLTASVPVKRSQG